MQKARGFARWGPELEWVHVTIGHQLYIRVGAGQRRADPNNETEMRATSVPGNHHLGKYDLRGGEVSCHYPFP
jgi:hypothetical protein